MITVTLSFTTIASAIEALRLLPDAAQTNAQVGVSGCTGSACRETNPEVRSEMAATEAAAAKPAAAKPAPSPKPTPVKTEQLASAPAPAPAPAPEPTPIDYLTLQKAVVELHGLDKTAALPIATGAGFKTFIEMKGNQAAINAAHAAVLAKIAAIRGASHG